MIWQTWRQHRAVVFGACTILGGLVTMLLILGGRLYRSVDMLTSAACAGPSTCDATQAALSAQTIEFHNVSLSLLAVPALVGLFVGAPLIAREFEQRTYQLAWTQGVTRRRWFVVQVALLSFWVAIGAGILAIVVSWGEHALLNPALQNSGDLGSERFSVWGFDLSGIVSVAYGLFAFALGVAAGAILLRVLPAIAVTLAGVLAVRLPVALWIRPHIETPLVATKSLFFVDDWLLTPSPYDWRIQQGFLHDGQRFAGNMQIPDYCAQTTSSTGLDALGQCLQAHGWSQYILYQPADRYWLFQGVEALIFLTLATVLLIGGYLLVLRRSA